MKYAINLADLLGHQTDIGLQVLLLPILDKEQVFECERGRIDGASIPLDCDEERAGVAVEIVRMNYEKHQLRIYRSKTGNGGWKRV